MICGLWTLSPVNKKNHDDLYAVQMWCYRLHHWDGGLVRAGATIDIVIAWLSGIAACLLSWQSWVSFNSKHTASLLFCPCVSSSLASSGIAIWHIISLMHLHVYIHTTYCARKCFYMLKTSVEFGGPAGFRIAKRPCLQRQQATHRSSVVLTSTSWAALVRFFSRSTRTYTRLGRHYFTTLWQGCLWHFIRKMCPLATWIPE